VGLDLLDEVVAIVVDIDGVGDDLRRAGGDGGAGRARGDAFEIAAGVVGVGGEADAIDGLVSNLSRSECSHGNCWQRSAQQAQATIH
jgi:hypothetical protein